jgi:hypothetical protein
MVAGSDRARGCKAMPNSNSSVAVFLIPVKGAAAIESGTPAPVLTAALFSRFTSRGEADYGDKLLSALRFEFGGHHEKST